MQSAAIVFTFPLATTCGELGPTSTKGTTCRTSTAVGRVFNFGPLSNIGGGHMDTAKKHPKRNKRKKKNGSAGGSSNSRHEKPKPKDFRNTVSSILLTCNRHTGPGKQMEKIPRRLSGRSEVSLLSRRTSGMDRRHRLPSPSAIPRALSQ